MSKNNFVLSDLPPEKDLLSFNRYVEPITRIVSEHQSETPFTIGVFGTWGTGKTAVL